MRYRHEIDGLRALAVVPVVWSHAGFPGLAGGHLGVDIFFVLSGFLITAILAGELAEGRFSIVRFYERRARRILPALFVVVLAALPTAWLLMTPAQLMIFGQSLVALGLFLPNIFFWRQSDYFAPAMEEAPMLHTWSLGVEEQFYLIFPLLLAALWRRGAAPVVAALALLCFVSFGLAEGAQQLGHGREAFYLLPMRAWELLAGALAALWLRHTGGMVGRGAGLLAALGLAMILFALVRLGPEVPGPGLVTLLPVFGTVLVLVAARPGTWVQRVLSWPLFTGIGLISYSAYLWHQPLFAFARIAGQALPGPGVMALLAGLTFLLAWLTWRFVEQPFRRGGQGSAAPRRVILAAAAGLAGIVGLGLVGHWGKGLAEWRFAPGQVALFATAAPSPMRRPCHVNPAHASAPDGACVYFAETPPSWAVIGDSHGVEIAHALAEQLSRRGESLVQLTASGCPPALGYESTIPGCAAWTERSSAWLAGQAGITHVLITYRHALYLGTGQARIGAPTPAEARALYTAGLARLVARLSAPGRRIWVMAPVPEPGVPMAKLVRDAGALVMPRPAPTPTWRATLPPGSAVLDPARALCAGLVCAIGQGGQAFYFDDNHLSLAGARKVAALLFVSPAFAATR